MAWSYDKFKGSNDLSAADKKRKEIESQKPSGFNYADYVESDTVKQAKNQLNSLQKPGEFKNQWQQSVNDTINKILNRDKFSYDVNGDALYQQYKDQYTTQGKMAMMDTMGQAAALTGGYGNSYAQNVGQQAYQGYLQKLNDKIPELYQIALDRYNKEGEDLYDQYSLFADRENTDYSRYRDKVSDYNTERDYLTNLLNNERNWDYGLYSDKYNRDYTMYRDSVDDWKNELSRADDNYFNMYDREYNKYSDDRNLSYTDYRNTVADKQWQDEFKYQKEQDAIANQLAIDKLNASISSGNGGNGGDDNTVVPADPSSPGIKNFQAGIKTSNEYYARGGKRGTYNDYVYETLEKWLDNGKITEAEAAYLIGHYGF